MSRAPDMERDGFSRAPDTERDGFSRAPDTEGDGFSRAPDTERDGFSRAPDTERDGFSRAPDTEREGFSRAPDMERDGFSRAPDTEREGFSRAGEITMTPRHAGTIGALALLAFITSACASGASVAQVKTNPGRYVEKSVTVRGTVTSAWGIPMVPFKMYRVEDGTGDILVVSDHSRVPSKGARVRVTGRVEEFAMLGGRSIGLHLRERDLDFLD